MGAGSGLGMRRVFVALAPTLELARELRDAVEPVLAEDSGWRLPAASHIHLTLAFLGDIAEKRLPELEEIVAEATRGRPAPRLLVRGTGAFPDWPRPKVLWLGVAEAPGSERHLFELQEAIAEGLRLARMRFDDKGVFVPHLTVARPARRTRRGARDAAPSDGHAAPALETFRHLSVERPWTPDAVLSIESRLGAPSPKRYPVLARHPLEGS